MKNIVILADTTPSISLHILSHLLFIEQRANFTALVIEETLDEIETAFNEAPGRYSSNLSFHPLEEAGLYLTAQHFDQAYIFSSHNTGELVRYGTIISLLKQCKTTPPTQLINYNLRQFPYRKDEFEAVVPCDICGEGMTFYRHTTYPSMETCIPLYQCPECGFVSQDYSTINSKEMQQMYADLIVPWMNFLGEMVDQGHRQCLDTLKKHLPNQADIVDLGSGMCGLEYYARRDGDRVRITSLELNKAAIEWCQGFGITAHPVDISNREQLQQVLLECHIEKPDALYSNNSLEHLCHPRATLAIWRELVKPGGILYIIIPTIDHVSDDYRGFEKYHLSYFRKHNLRLLAETLNLEILLLQGVARESGAGTGVMQAILRKPP